MYLVPNKKSVYNFIFQCNFPLDPNGLPCMLSQTLVSIDNQFKRMFAKNTCLELLHSAVARKESRRKKTYSLHLHWQVKNIQEHPLSLMPLPRNDLFYVILTSVSKKQASLDQIEI